MKTTPFIIRGFLIGSSLGIFSVLLGFMTTSEGIVFGSTAGVLAGYSSARLAERLKKKREENGSAGN
ncbi:MAG: hypothetical protein J6I40_08790 [Mailhella sp.]|nr:hypothetical protein [Mailhella sp.]